MLRRATRDDGPEVATLFRRSYGTLTFLPTLHTPEEDREYFTRVAVEQEVWLWEEDGRILGFASIDAGDEIAAFYVDPDAQGRGIGSALFERLAERRPAGFRFWVFQRNEHARRFYERRGAVAIAFTDGSANEEREPDVLYAWHPPGTEGGREA